MDGSKDRVANAFSGVQGTPGNPRLRLSLSSLRTSAAGASSASIQGVNFVVPKSFTESTVNADSADVATADNRPNQKSNKDALAPSDGACSCEPKPKPHQLLKCSRCDKHFHGSCQFGLSPNQEAMFRKGRRKLSSTFVCVDCRKLGTVARELPNGVQFGCCGHTMETGREVAWPCAGCDVWHHAACLGIEDSALVRQLECAMKNRWWCSGCSRVGVKRARE